MRKAEDILKDATVKAWEDQNFTHELIALDAIEQAQKEAIEETIEKLREEFEFHGVESELVDEVESALLGKVGSDDEND